LFVSNVLSAGGKLLEGYYSNCEEAIENTVREFVSAVHSMLESNSNSLRQVLIAPVAPHAYRSRKNGKALGRDMRRERTLLWNNFLQRVCESYSDIYFLNYEAKLRQPDSSNSVGFVLHPAYNADYTHLNSAYLPKLEEAIIECNCKMDLL